MRRRTGTFALCFACTLLGAAVAVAATYFEATLDGQQNVPPIAAVTATGTAMLTLNDDETELTFYIEYSGLSSNELYSHIHNANDRSNGPIAFELPAGTPKSGVWQIPPNYVTELLAERLYINIHTDMYNVGEIRGQIRHKTVPIKPATIGALKSRYAGP